MSRDQDLLEAELLRRYDQLHPREEKHMPWKTMFVAAVVLLAAGAAPAQYAAEVGRKVEISLANPGQDVPTPENIVPVLREAGTHMNVEVKMIHDAGVRYEFSLWGDGIAQDLEARLRSAFPALKDATIAVSSIEGRVKTSFAGVLHKKLLQAGDDPVKLEAARREIQAQLQKENPGAEVDVEAAPDGKQRIRVLKKK